ncbi:hypothetical protein J4206_04440 [Candidatus Woesearchaeota archaeon]|nr:hypothetical protein [Candidatus Woesearchaeota archaeon]
MPYNVLFHACTYLLLRPDERTMADMQSLVKSSQGDPVRAIDYLMRLATRFDSGYLPLCTASTPNVQCPRLSHILGTPTEEGESLPLVIILENAAAVPRCNKRKIPENADEEGRSNIEDFVSSVLPLQPKDPGNTPPSADLR